MEGYKKSLKYLSHRHKRRLLLKQKSVYLQNYDEDKKTSTTVKYSKTEPQAEQPANEVYSTTSTVSLDVSRYNMPVDARTLLKTPRITNLQLVPPGWYCHIGLERGIIRSLEIYYPDKIPEETFFNNLMTHVKVYKGFRYPGYLKTNDFVDGLQETAVSTQPKMPHLKLIGHGILSKRYCETLKEAMIKSTKEVSTDDEQLGKGFRAVKPKNYFSPDASVPRKRLPRDVQYELPPAPPDVQYEFSPAPPSAAPVPPIKQVATLASTLEEGYADYFVNEACTLENLEQNSEHTDSNSQHTITEIGTEYNHRDEAIRDNEEASAGFLATVNGKFDKIIEILSEHKLILDELLENRKTKSSLPLVDFNLPLKTLQDIDILEEKLRDQNILGRLVFLPCSREYNNNVKIYQNICPLPANTLG